MHIIPEAHTHYLVYLHNEAGDDHAHFSEPPQHGARLILGGNAPRPMRNLHGIDNVHEFLELGFPLPYFLVFIGYTFILIIDKVMFDSHALVHDHGENNKWRESLRKSLRESRGRSNSHAGFEAEINENRMFEDKKNYNEFRDEGEPTDQGHEDDVNEGIRRFLSRADRFSARIDSELSSKYKRGSKSVRKFEMKANTGDHNSNTAVGQRREFIEETMPFEEVQRGIK